MLKYKYLIFFIINFRILYACCNSCKNIENDIITNQDEKDEKDKENKEDKGNKLEGIEELDEKYKNDVDYQYLSKNKKDIKDLKLYIDVKNLYSDEIPDISNIKDITTDEILKFLHIDEAKNEIDRCDNINEKIKKLADIISDDYNNKRFTFENSNLLVPRCLIVHENNNCILEAYFSYLESNPYHCKFFWILNELFEKNQLNKNELPITYEICQFFKNAINNPNFNDKIYCLNISKTWYDNIEKLKGKIDNKFKKILETHLKKHHFGGFQGNWYPYILIHSVILELQNFYNFQDNKMLYEYNKDKDKDITIFYFNSIFAIASWLTTHDKLNKNNCKDYLFKDQENNIMTGYTFVAAGYHFYTIRNINCIFFNYDSLIYDKPKVISNKDLIKLLLNLHCKKNFNGNYKEYYIGMIFRFNEIYI